jgi:hypothetical protein
MVCDFLFPDGDSSIGDGESSGGRIPIMAAIIQWTVCSLPIDQSQPFLGHHQVDLQKEIDGADLLETPRLFSG